MDWPGWITAVVAVMGLGGALYVWFAKQIADESDARLKLERDLSDYKLYVAQNLVTSSKMKETEERLIAALDKVVLRLDLLGSRMGDLTVQLASTARD